MAPLHQPWKDYLAQKAVIEQNLGEDGTSLKKPDAEKGETAMCPGSEECGRVPHALGSTVFCAFRSDMACEVVMQGSTGTSG